jgi:hypothetical protein
MQAAVVSMLLMAGACADSGEPLPAPGPVFAAPVQASQPAPLAEAPVFNPPYSGATTYPSPAGGIYWDMGALGHIRYTPVYLLKDSAAYYPGNYARPYDYREIFNYPWHGPRPAAPGPAIEIEAVARKRDTMVR